MILPTCWSATSADALRCVIGIGPARVVDAAPHVRGLVDAGQRDEHAAPLLLVLHRGDRGVGRPDVTALVRRVVARPCSGSRRAGRARPARSRCRTSPPSRSRRRSGRTAGEERYAGTLIPAGPRQCCRSPPPLRHSRSFWLLKVIIRSVLPPASPHPAYVFGLIATTWSRVAWRAGSRRAWGSRRASWSGAICCSPKLLVSHMSWPPTRRVASGPRAVGRRRGSPRRSTPCSWAGRRW